MSPTAIDIVQPVPVPVKGAATARNPPLIPAPAANILCDENKIYGDFRDDLVRQGFTVVKNVIPRDRAVAYHEKAYEWLQSFPGTQLDFDNPTTWVEGNLPRQSAIRTYDRYCVTHEKFMWDARLEPGVIDTFAKLWETDQLLVSFDGLNVTLPNRKDVERRKPWEHIDQSPLRRGVHCIQGIINLSPFGPEDGGLTVFPGFQKYNDEFFDAKSPEDKDKWFPLTDQYLFKQHELDWFAARGLKAHKVCADVGDLILWDSRVIHYGAEPTEKSSQIRTIIYAAYTPVWMASPDQLALKRKAFYNYSSTTHWPHDHIVARSKEALLADGSRDPNDREEPTEKPEMTDILLRLAGVKPY
ncbi:hypothetical protein ACHAPT_013568 [Fusarium lateritium]